MEGCHRKADAMQLNLCIGNAYDHFSVVITSSNRSGPASLVPGRLLTADTARQYHTSPGRRAVQLAIPRFHPGRCASKTLISRIILTNSLFFSQFPGP